MVAYTYGTGNGLNKMYNTVMEGAMLYNATMSVVYPAYGDFDETAMMFNAHYNNPKAASANASEFLFVGNSST